MKIIILYGQGSVGKSYVATHLTPLLENRNETVRYICMDHIVGMGRLNSDHWEMYNQLLYQAGIEDYDNIVLDFANIDQLCDVFCKWNGITRSNISVYLFQLYPYSFDTIIDNMEKRMSGGVRVLTSEFKANMRRAYEHTQAVSGKEFERFGFRSVQVYLLRDQNTYLNDIIDVLLGDSEGGDDSGSI